jgi:DNA modification methylase
MELKMGTFTQTKTKQALAEKSKAAKSKNKHKAELASLATTAPTDLLCNMQLERRTIASLKGLAKRVRRSEKEQLERVARSIAKLKQSAPVLIDQSGEIINGHIVIEALKSLGEDEVWCAVIDHLDEDERALLHVTLNRIGETGDWDLGGLGELMIDFDDLGFDLATTGFSLPEIDIIMTPPMDEKDADAVEEPIALPNSPVSMLGDLWILDDHRLLCGDATDPGAYEALLEGELADMIFTDCPWNIPIAGFVSGLGKTKHEDFVQFSGERSEEEFLEFCCHFHDLGAKHLVEGGAFFSCIDWRSIDIVMAAGSAAGLRHAATPVWNKGSGGMGLPYRSAHEFVVMFCKGAKLAVNNIELGKHGRDRTSVWTYPGANRPGSSANNALALHPTAKPIELVRDAILDVSKRGALVLDPFMGSGTTIIAAETCGRRASGIELDPKYVDVIIRRWEQWTGGEAINAQAGLNLDELAARRAKGPGQAVAD